MSDLLPQPADLLPLLPGAAIGLVLLVIASRLRARGAAAPLAASAVVAALLTTWWQLHGPPPLLPAQSTERVLFGSCAWAVAAALLTRGRGWAVALALAFALAVASAVVLWVLMPLVDRPVDDPTHVSSWWCVAFGSGLTLVATGSGAAATRLPGPLVPAVLAVAAGAAGQVMVLFGSASLAQLLGALSILLAAAAVGVVFLAERRLPPACAVAVVGTSGLLAVDGWAFLDATPPAHVLLPLALVPLVPWLALAPRVRELCATRRTVVVLGAALAIAGVAVGLGAASMPEPDPYGDLYK